MRNSWVAWPMPSTRPPTARSSTPARRRSGTSSPGSDKPPMRRLCRRGSMRRKPLFPPPRDQTGQPKRNKGRQEKSALTINGRVRLRRIRWSSVEEGSTTPLDIALDAAEATVSLGVRELACRLNQSASSFDKAAENLGRAAQVRISGESLRQVVEAEGKAVLKAEQTGELVPGWTAADCTTNQGQGPTRVYLGSDGVKVPLVTDAEKKARRQKVRQKRRRRGKKARPLPASRRGADQAYKEFKIVVYYDEAEEHRHVSVTRGDHQVAGRLMRRDAGRIALDQADDKVAVVDGAEWIRNQIARQNLPMDDVGLDFYHLAEHVHTARRAVCGEEDEGGKTWAGAVLHTVKHEGYGAFWEALVSWRSKLRGARKRKAADQLLEYVSARKAMIQYPEFLAKGRQIGSGPTEAMCKTTTRRLKGSGMRWDGPNAEAVMTLAGLDQSDAWKEYWRICLKQAG